MFSSVMIRNLIAFEVLHYLLRRSALCVTSLSPQERILFLLLENSTSTVVVRIPSLKFAISYTRHIIAGDI